MKEMISSSSNKIVKYIKSLQMKKAREEYGEFLIEGEKLLTEALDYKVPVSMVLMSQSFAGSIRHDEYADILSKNKIQLCYAEDKVFSGVCETDAPQGIIAAAGKQQYELESIISKEELKIILLHELRDPGNAGTIIRTADACGLDAVFISKGSVDLYNGKTIRATMGSLFHIPVIQNLDTGETISLLRDKQVTTIGADPHSSISCTGLPYYKKSAIVIGNESQGINSGIKAMLDINTSIPMPGRAESLNAGIAASILMYEFSVRKKIINVKL